MSKKSRLISSLLTGFTVAFYFALVLPVQSYLANADSFNYTLGALLGDLCLPLVLTFVVASLALFFLSRWVGQFLHILLLALVVAAFVESGPLSIGLPELNGDFSGYKSLTRAIWDWSILLGIVLIPLCCYRWLRGSATWIALVLTVYLGATLFDVRVKSQRPEGMEDFIVPRLVPRTDVVRSAEFSPKRNVIMLILDSISVDACVDAFAADPDLASHFTGFVNYTNNVGMTWPTHMAIPGIFTGKYCESLEDLSKYGQSMWMKDSFIKPYLDRNIPVYVNVALSRDGYTNRLKPTEDVLALKKCSPTEDRMLGLYPMTLPEFMQFRALPYFAKEAYVSGLSFPTNSSTGQALDANRLFDDAYLWQALAKKPVNPGLEMTLHVHHVKGSHLPIRHKRDGRPAKQGDVSYGGYVDESLYAFRQVAQLLDAWKTNGVYDASTIIIAADHGIELKPGRARNDIPSFLFPFLMVKTKNSSGPIACSNMATSHCNLSHVVTSMASEDAPRSVIDLKLHSASRRGVNLSDKKRVWTLDEQGDVQMDALDFGDIHLTPVELDKVNSFRANTDEMFLNYHVKGGKRAMTDGTVGLDMMFTFKVPKINQTYDLRFWIMPISLKTAGKIVISSGGSKTCAAYDQTLWYLHTLLLKGVKASADGLVEIRVKNEPKNDQPCILGVWAVKISEHDQGNREFVGTGLDIGDVEIAANSNEVKCKTLVDKLCAGKTYGLQIEQGSVVGGNPHFVSVRILDRNDKVVDFSCFEVENNELNKCRWCFTIPREVVDPRCVVYAGEAMSNKGIGLKLKNVRLIELEK